MKGREGERSYLVIVQKLKVFYTLIYTIDDFAFAADVNYHYF